MFRFSVFAATPRRVQLQKKMKTTMMKLNLLMRITMPSSENSQLSLRSQETVALGKNLPLFVQGFPLNMTVRDVLKGLYRGFHLP